VALLPPNGSTGIPADAPVRVSFDHAMDRTTVIARLHVDPSLPGCNPVAAAHAAGAAACRIVWSTDSTQLTLEHPGALFAPSTKYSLSLEPGIRDQSGAENSLDHHWSLTSGPAPSLRSVSPGDGATDVPVDTAIAVTFSAPMDPRRTAAALTLSPPVPGTRVVANTRDHSRFVLLPGRLLDPEATYHVDIARTAADEHGQPFDTTAEVRFSTGGLSTEGHAVVLARRLADAGRDASRVLLTALGPAQAGDPTVAIPVLQSPTCAAARCGALVSGAPLVGYLGASLSPDGDHLAVVERDETVPPGSVRASLHILDLISGEETSIPAGTGPAAWSPRGRRLAYGAADGVHVLTAGRHDLVLPAGDPLSTAPVWSPDGTMLALPVHSADGRDHVDIAVPAARARYPLPALDATSTALTAPVFDPASATLCVRREGPPGQAGAWLVRLRGGDAAPRSLGADLLPVAYSDAGTLVAVARPADGGASQLVRVNLASGDRTAIPGGAAPAELGSVVASPSGGRLAFLLAGKNGVVQAMIENADGSNPEPLASFTVADGMEAVAVSLSG